jgi:hypothetical protein
MNQLSIIKEMCACSWLEREKYIKRRGEENSFKKERWRRNLIKKKMYALVNMWVHTRGGNSYLCVVSMYRCKDYIS